MRIHYILLFIMLGQAGFSQVTLPPFYGLFADGSSAVPTTNPVGGNAICDGTRPTAVVPITSTTGRVWMDRNLGASRAATSSIDYEAYGCLYQWGRGNDGHASITWTSGTVGTPVNGSTATLATTNIPGNALFITNSTSPYDWRNDNNNNRWQGINGINNPCPTGYRIPTSAEFANEFTAYVITNSATAYANGPSGGFKFTLAGHRRYQDATLSSQGFLGYYWSSTINVIYTYYYYIDINNATKYQHARAFGFSVRCLKD